jgi:hypothetical protein
VTTSTVRPTVRPGLRRAPALASLASLASLALLGTTLAPAVATGAHAAADPSADRAAGRTARAAAVRISHTSFGTGEQWRTGSLSGVRVRKGRLVLTDSAGTRSFDGRRYDRGSWTSPWVSPGFSLTELVPSWQAVTRRDSWIEVSVRGRAADGRQGSWDTMARWTSSERWVRRTSLGEQPDDLGRANVDTWQTGGVASWQVRVSLMRRAGTRTPVKLQRVGAVASRLPDRSDVSTSEPTRQVGTELDLPAYSQMVHRGHYPEWGGGGQAWCSPTSVSMVLGYLDALPAPRTYAWVGDGHPSPWVDQAARMTFDHGYDGAGNWPFNTAFAGSLVREAYVTRLRNLRQAERLVADGVPPVVSVRFGSGELDNAPISSTDGHLMVIVGFTASGDVIAHDPAAASSSGVRRVYDRGQFEDVWLPTSGGLAYVIRD